MLTGDQLASFRDDRVRVPLTPTGFVELDRVTGGMLRGKVWIACSEPGQGRTTLLTQWATKIAGAGNPTSLAALRDDTASITERLLSALTLVPLIDLQRGAIGTQTAVRLQLARERLASMPLHLHMSDEFPTAHERFQTGASGAPDALLIDDADLIPGFTPAILRRYVSAGSFVLITMPRHLLLRGRGPEADLDPQWARVADVILEVRHRGLPNGRLRPGEAELTVHYNRTGPGRLIEVLFQGHWSRFVDGRAT